MEELTNFGFKNSLTLPSLANNYFNSLRDENNKYIYTYTDLFMRNLNRSSIKRCRCNDFNQHCKSETSDVAFKMISKELNVNGDIYNLLESTLNF